MAGMEEGDNPLLLGNQESIGVSPMILIIQIKTSAKNSILTVKLFKINKTDPKIVLKASFNQIILALPVNLKNHVVNPKTDLIKQVLWQKEWDTMSELQFQKR